MKFAGRKRHAFSLVEVVIALGVVSFCLLTTLALLPVGVASSRDSLQKTTAASIASEISSDCRLLTNNATLTPRFQLKTATAISSTNTLFFGSDDSFATTASNTSLYRATVIFGPINSGYTMPLRILVTWPALGDPNASQSPANYTGSLDVSTAVNTLSQ